MAIARKAPLRATKAAAPIYQLRIELLDVSPAIWRRLLVPGSIKLHKLHAVLLWTMGWAGGHLHEFVIGHDHYGEPIRTSTRRRACNARSDSRSPPSWVLAIRSSTSTTSATAGSIGSPLRKLWQPILR
jgi:hypothetical protein